MFVFAQWRIYVCLCFESPTTTVPSSTEYVSVHKQTHTYTHTMVRCVCLCSNAMQSRTVRLLCCVAVVAKHTNRSNNREAEIAFKKTFATTTIFCSTYCCLIIFLMQYCCHLNMITWICMPRTKILCRAGLTWDEVRLCYLKCANSAHTFEKRHIDA